MKKSFNLFFVLVAVLMLSTACEKGKLDEVESRDSGSLVALDLSYQVVEGVLTFPSAESVHALSKRIAQMTEEEKTEFYEILEFKSYGMLQREVVSKIANSCNEEGRYEILAEYPGIIEEVVCDDGSIGVDLIETLHTYSSLCNVEGIFCVSNQYHKIVKGGLNIVEANSVSEARAKLANPRKYGTVEIETKDAMPWSYTDIAQNGIYTIELNYFIQKAYVQYNACQSAGWFEIKGRVVSKKDGAWWDANITWTNIHTETKIPNKTYSG